MKTTKFLFILLLPLLFVQGVKGQGYIPLVDTNKTWSTLNNIPDFQFTYWTKFPEDTIIAGIIYKKVLISDTVPNLSPKEFVAGFIREDTLNKEVYFMNVTYEEGLIYDFSVSTGDTIIIHNRCYYSLQVPPSSNSEISLVVDTIFFTKIIPPYYTSFSHNIPLLDNLERKIIVLKGTYNYFFDVWIEGIGSIYGVLESGNYDYQQRVLLCYSEENNLVYFNPEFNSCVFHCLNVNEYSMKFKIYPNPANNFFIIENNNHKISEFQIDIFDVFGNILFHEIFDGHTSKINIQEFKSGIYFIRIYINQESSVLYKLTIIK